MAAITFAILNHFFPICFPETPIVTIRTGLGIATASFLEINKMNKKRNEQNN
jgi:hypothetical protein